MIKLDWWKWWAIAIGDEEVGCPAGDIKECLCRKPGEVAEVTEGNAAEDMAGNSFLWSFPPRTLEKCLFYSNTSSVWHVKEMEDWLPVFQGILHSKQGSELGPPESQSNTSTTIPHSFSCLLVPEGYRWICCCSATRQASVRHDEYIGICVCSQSIYSTEIWSSWLMPVCETALIMANISLVTGQKSDKPLRKGRNHIFHAPTTEGHV